MSTTIGSFENSEVYLQRGPRIPFSFDINVLFSGYEKCDPLHFAGPCYKAAYLFHIVLDGKGTLKVNNAVYNLKKHDMFLISPSDYVFYQADEDDPWEYKWIKFDGASVKFLLENAGLTGQSVFSCVSDEQWDVINGYMDRTLEYMVDEVAHYVRATGMFYVAFGWFLNEFGEDRKQTPDKMSFIKIINFITENFTKSLDMDTIARRTNYNRSHIYRLFMKNMNCSPKVYIDNLRLSLACEMLHETQYQIRDIVYKVGFKNYISFITAFKKKYGVLPTDYRADELLGKITTDKAEDK
ncbi:MAG: AraC family transcriptional regulator [Clostridiales bacterium]|jgi:AraC-like DNA-binding protein|nr:AraC family transcriptional regulator [Clostridiales bacterium]